jgi:hypothetical protein
MSSSMLINSKCSKEMIREQTWVQSPVPAKKFQWKKVIRIEGSNLTASNFKYLLKHVSLPGKSS